MHEVRIECKQNIYCGCCALPATAFSVYQPCKDEYGRVAYFFAGQFAVDGHNAADAACLREYERLRSSLDTEMWLEVRLEA